MAQSTTPPLTHRKKQRKNDREAEQKRSTSQSGRLTQSTTQPPTHSNTERKTETQSQRGAHANGEDDPNHNPTANTQKQRNQTIGADGPIHHPTANTQKETKKERHRGRADKEHKPKREDDPIYHPTANTQKHRKDDREAKPKRSTCQRGG